MPSDNFTLRMPDALHEALEERAEETDLSKAEVARRYIEYGEASQGDRLANVAELEARIDRTIEQNQTLRNVLPSKWEAHVRRLFLDDIRDDASPEDIRVLADGYRRQGRQYEDLLEQIPHGPDVEPGTHEQIVDEQLQYALQAADLSNWYDRVDNPYAHLEGVESGLEEREDLLALVRGVLGRVRQIRDEFGIRDHTVTAEELPQMAHTLVPDRFDLEDVADGINQLADAGVRPEDVDDELPVVQALEGEHDGDDVVDVEANGDGGDDGQGDGMIQMGGKLYPDGLPDDEEQAPLPGRVPASDGGRSDGSPFGESSSDQHSGSETNES